MNRAKSLNVIATFLLYQSKPPIRVKKSKPSRTAASRSFHFIFLTITQFTGSEKKPNPSEILGKWTCVCVSLITNDVIK